MKRLESITIDDIPESGAIERLIEDNTYSIFPTVLTTERPDRVMGALLEGRVSILVDGTPFTLLVPATVDEFIHSLTIIISGGFRLPFSGRFGIHAF